MENKENTPGSSQASARTSKEASPVLGNLESPECLAPPLPAKTHKPSKGKREDKDMRKDVKIMEDILKKIGPGDNPAFEGIVKKYQIMYDELKKGEKLTADWQASYNILRRERDSINSENQRLLMRVGKTESVCRFQQQQAKQVKDEFQGKLRDEQEKRKDVTGKLQETLRQLDIVLNENSARSNKLHEENIDMSQKLCRLHDQISMHNEETRNNEKQLQLQKKLFETELSKTQLEFQAQKDLLNRQIELLQLQVKEKDAEIKFHKDELSKMEGRVDEYIKKYNDMEPFISQSNNLFKNYKGKIEEMSSNNTKLENEVFLWQRKYNDSVRSLLDLTVASKEKDADFKRIQKKADSLDKLCRQIQIDRSNYLKQLKAANIQPGVETEEVNANGTDDKDVVEITEDMEKLQVETEESGAQCDNVASKENPTE